MPSIRKIKADLLITNAGPIQEDQVLIIDPAGKILAIESLKDHDPPSVQLLHGALVPGFVNAHCHLELSHLKGKVESGIGLIKFIEGVVSMRDSSNEEIQDAIFRADREMFDEGIIAVGDICNQTDTVSCKDSSPIFYYSFVEMFDFWQDQLAETFYNQYKSVFDAITESPGHTKSAVPHAPYSVSKTLFGLINGLNSGVRSVSIHNQETAAENQMFQEGNSPFISLFEKMGFFFDQFSATGKTSIHYALENLDLNHRQLFIHNTCTNQDDIRSAQLNNKKSYWVSCPNANLYIENKLPNYRYFLDEGVKVCLGTDSLTSNWQLSILEEMKTIQKYQSTLSLEQLVGWASQNGAEALGIEDRFGTISPGKSPGINLIKLDPAGRIDQQSKVEKLA